ncbi:hypothetical protein MCOR25_005744 [Pyricularia grisea]|nr:hypothetical protein MCOR25_005744 [Pyricularia grisea]
MRPRNLALAIAATISSSARTCIQAMTTDNQSNISAIIHQGFNYGAQNVTGGCRGHDDYTRLFNLARSLPSGNFTSARIYTSIECGTEGAQTPKPISAFQAAVETNTSLLVGLWASEGQDEFTKELNALKSALSDPTYGSQLAGLVVGVAVGSEDMYRADSITRGTCGANVSQCAAGATADQLVAYVQQTRAALQGTALAAAAIGHVDTPDSWASNGSAALVQQLDWVGHNSFPYWESSGQDNGIDAAGGRFQGALGVTIGAAGGRPVWVTETGWPANGPKLLNAEATPANAMKYFHDVGRQQLFGQRNTWWYILEDSNPNQSSLSFAVWNQTTGQTTFSLEG